MQNFIPMTLTQSTLVLVSWRSGDLVTLRFVLYTDVFDSSSMNVSNYTRKQRTGSYLLPPYIFLWDLPFSPFNFHLLHSNFDLAAIISQQHFNTLAECCCASVLCLTSF